jgi:hypothetical protein
LPGVYDHVTEVVIIFIATGQYDRFCSLTSTASDPGETWAMNTGPRQFLTRGKTTSFRIGGNVTEYL